MSTCGLSLLFCVAGFLHLGYCAAPVELVPAGKPAALLSGPARSLSVLFHNPAESTASVKLSLRVYQASSATAAPVRDLPWRTLAILPGQTVLEQVTLDLPPVRGQTRFLLQWLTEHGRVIGITDVLAYPTNLLVELRALAGNEPVGVLDPQEQLKPLLKNLGVDFLDLGERELEHFAGKLAILGPFTSHGQMQAGLAIRAKTLAGRGISVVWYQPPDEQQAGLSYYLTLHGRGAIVVVQPAQLERFAEDPLAQLALIKFARLARRAERLGLPDV